MSTRRKRRRRKTWTKKLRKGVTMGRGKRSRQKIGKREEKFTLRSTLTHKRFKIFDDD